MTTHQDTIKHSKPRKSGKAVAQADASGPTDKTVTFIRYDVAVAEGKEIVERAVSDQLRLGELAHKVETKYGDRTLATFAGDIGIAACTLERHRSVYRAWMENRPSGPISYGVLRTLQDHPDRFNIVADNPKLTQAEARKFTRPFKDSDKAKCGTKPEKGEESEWTKHNRKLFSNLVRFAIDATNAVQAVLDSPPEKQREFLQVVEPLLIGNLRVAGHTLIAFVDHIYKLQDQAAAEGRPAEAEKPAAILQAAE